MQESNTTLRNVFQELIQEKDRYNDEKTSVIVLKTAMGNLWHFSFNCVPCQPELDREFLESMRQAEDTEVQYVLVCHRAAGAGISERKDGLDVPGWTMREGLLALHPANANARIFLHGEQDGESVYITKTLESISPPETSR